MVDSYCFYDITTNNKTPTTKNYQPTTTTVRSIKKWHEGRGSKLFVV
jgi:hypothetical protein